MVWKMKCWSHQSKLHAPYVRLQAGIQWSAKVCAPTVSWYSVFLPKNNGCWNEKCVSCNSFQCKHVSQQAWSEETSRIMFILIFSKCVILVKVTSRRWECAWDGTAVWCWTLNHTLQRLKDINLPTSMGFVKGIISFICIWKVSKLLIWNLKGCVNFCTSSRVAVIRR